ncbi:TetR/AcrR family transcriptional regulator [Propionibacteriaceae bacterium Y2011]|uniref:TetR/AcrR family transcriptional regulator n=1 Tax=Microlunatus sp. Y2014 TaxID=3418488 RepID=UPI003B495BE0
MAGGAEVDDPIIRGVWQVIATDGLGAVTMRTVAQAAGVSVGRIQYRYGSKEDLLLASAAAMINGAAARHEAVRQTAEGDETLWHLLSHVIPHDHTTTIGVSVFHHFVAAGITRPRIAALLAEAKRGQQAEVATLLRPLLSPAADPQAAARALVATADGLSLQVLTGAVEAAAAAAALRAELDRVTAATAPSAGALQ